MIDGPHYLWLAPYLRLGAFALVCLLAYFCIRQARTLRRPSDRRGFYS